MNKAHESPISDHERLVQDHYDSMTRGFYLRWNPDHIHLGVFEPGECPRHSEHIKDSPGVARAVERMIEVIVAPAGIEERHHGVDAGCGVGGTAIYLAKSHGCAVTGINLSRLQLEMADKKAIDAGLDDRVSFAFANCSLSLPFADDSVDVVVNIESARHYSDRRRFLCEVNRILKPGGKIVASDWMARDGLTSDEYEKYIVPLCKPFVVDGLESPSSYTEMLRQAGLEVMECAGFDGKDADNLRIIEYSCTLLAILQSSGTRTPGISKINDQLKPLRNAWKSRCFEVRRYCAQKPG